MEPVCDTFWNGRLTVWQPARKNGYRFNLDPVLLAAFAPAARNVVELGAGCGVLSMLLLASGKARHIIAVERQAALAQLCHRNAVANGWAAKMIVKHADLRNIGLPTSDAVIFNPPYFTADDKRLSPVMGRDEARSERHGTLHDFVGAAARCLAPAGQVAAIVPVQRRAALDRALQAHGLTSTRRRCVAPRPEAPPHLVMVLAQRAAASLCLPTEPALAIHGRSGRAFSPGVEAWVRGEVLCKNV